MKKLQVVMTVVLSLFISTGIVYAATRNVTSTLGGATGDIFEVSGGLKANNLTVGAQGTGGVTFFNGTIVNITTTAGADNPVTFGDNVRIDGRIYRGATAGTSDTLPVIINDNLEVAGSLSVASIASSGVVSSANLADNAVTSAKITDGTIVAADLATNAVTQNAEDENTTITTIKTGTSYDTAAELTISTGNNPVFCVFSGYGSNDTSGEDIRIALIYDGVIQAQTYRASNSESIIGSGLVALATNDIATFTAGSHTIQVGWNTTGGIASLFYNTLNCVELKK
ncbi:MAG: hypothetical protein ABIH38_03400 [Patescibacteria group bacterium]